MPSRRLGSPLQAALGLAPTGTGAVCFKTAEGQTAARAQTDALALLGGDPAAPAAVSHDEYGSTWVTVHRIDADLPALVTALHAVNITLADAGVGPTLLAPSSASPQPARRLGLVYLFKRGTVYPFAPTGGATPTWRCKSAPTSPARRPSKRTWAAGFRSGAHRPYQGRAARPPARRRSHREALCSTRRPAGVPCGLRAGPRLRVVAAAYPGEMEPSASVRPAKRSSARWRLIAILVAVLAGLVAGYLAVGRPGMDDGTDRTGPGGQEPVASVGVEEFAARMADRDVVVINVHTPYEGELEGTDLFIPFDRIAGDPRLPADRDTEILLYCRSGSMSDQARRTLQSTGYLNVVDLDGGMHAWEAAGRPIVTR